MGQSILLKLFLLIELTFVLISNCIRLLYLLRQIYRKHLFELQRKGILKDLHLLLSRPHYTIFKFKRMKSSFRFVYAFRTTTGYFHKCAITIGSKFRRLNVFLICPLAVIDSQMKNFIDCESDQSELTTFC